MASPSFLTVAVGLELRLCVHRLVVTVPARGSVWAAVLARLDDKLRRQNGRGGAAADLSRVDVGSLELVDSLGKPVPHDAQGALARGQPVLLRRANADVNGILHCRPRWAVMTLLGDLHLQGETPWIWGRDGQGARTRPKSALGRALASG